jgi:hypothetical protein
MVAALVAIWSVPAKMFHSPRQILSWTRHVSGCGEDMTIPTAISRVIWAHSHKQPLDNDPEMVPIHTARGSSSVGILGREPIPPPPKDGEYFDVKMDNFYVPAESYDDADTKNKTSYICGGFELPKKFLDGKRRHMIRASPLVQEGNELKVHHIIMYWCNDVSDESLSYRGHCSSPNMPGDLAACNAQRPVFAGWAVGGTDLILEHGFPVGNDDGDSMQRMIFEVHYDNYDQKPFYDSSGMRLHVTEDLLENEGGIFFTGSVFGINIPGGEKNYELHNRCPGHKGGCLTEDSLPAEGITITHSLMHMHTTGVAITAKVIDGETGKVKGVVGNEPHYDFNMQQYFKLDKEVKMLPGDHLDVDCTFNTMRHSEAVVGGLGTQNEMCLAFLIYYPRIPMHGCFMYNVPEDYNMTRDGFKIVDITEDGRNMAHCKPDGKTDHLFTDYSMDRVLEPEEECVASTPPAGAELQTMSHGFTDTKDVDQFLGSFAHSYPLHDDMDLYWTHNEAENTVDFTVDVRASGWVGLGLSKSGGMGGADMIMGWITEEGDVHMQDRHSEVSAMPVVDSVQSIWNVKGTRFDWTISEPREAALEEDVKLVPEERGEGKGEVNVALIAVLSAAGGAALVFFLLGLAYHCCPSKSDDISDKTVELSAGPDAEPHLCV